MSEEEDENGIICPCPVCGEELAELDELWRQIHINGCLTKSKPSLLNKCEVEKCPICGKKLSHLSASLANRHINECMDKKTSFNSSKKKSERCPFCGQCIKNLSERQRKLHDQTCRKTERVIEVDVVQYPKRIESLPTPNEWEVEQEFRPQFVMPLSQPMPKLELLNYGTPYQTWEIQGVQGFEFMNDPLTLTVPPGFEECQNDVEC